MSIGDIKNFTLKNVYFKNNLSTEKGMAFHSSAMINMTVENVTLIENGIFPNGTIIDG